MKHDLKRLERAAKLRQQKLRRITEDLTACDCTWPLDRYRNGSGHDSSCPVHKRHEKERYERESEEM